MRKIYTLLLLLFAAGTISAFAVGTVNNRLPLDLNLQKKNKIADSIRKAAASRADEGDAAEEPTEEEWTLLGTGKYTDDIMTNTGVPSMTWEVEIYESKSTPGFYRVENPYGNGKCPYFAEPFECCDFLLHAEKPDAVWMEYVEIKDVDFGLMEDGIYCPAYTGDMAGYYIAEGYFDAATAIEMGMAGGKMRGGCITFAKKGLMLNFPLYTDGQETGLNLYSNLEGLFCVALPGAADYSFKVEGTDMCADGPVSIAYKAGADIAEVKYAVYKGMLDFEGSDDQLYEKVKSEGVVAKDGSVSVEPEYGIHTVAFAAMSADGEIMGTGSFYCFGQQDEADKWKSIGKAEYSEGVLSSIYPDEVSVCVYEVDIQESTTTPGRYRLVDLYGPAYTHYDNLVKDENILGHKHHHYTVVDATDPDMVYIEACPLGADFGYGQVMMFSEGWFSMQMGLDLTDEFVLEGFGTLKDGKITFLGGAIFLYMPQYGMPRGNTNHKFYIKLPGADEGSINEVAAGTDADAATFYNLSGVRMSGRPSVPGVYVKVTEGKAEKVMVK